MSMKIKGIKFKPIKINATLILKSFLSLSVISSRSRKGYLVETETNEIPVAADIYNFKVLCKTYLIIEFQIIAL